MAPPRAQKPSHTYPEWLAAGKPPIMVHKARMWDWIEPNITRTRVGQLLSTGHLIALSDGMIDTSHPVNAEWLCTRESGYTPPRPPGRTKAVRAAGGSVGETYDHYATTGRQKPAAVVCDSDPTGPADLAGFDLEVILEAIENMDLTKLPAAQVDKVRKMEVAFKTRTERMQKRGQLIDRSLVASVFGRLYMIDTNQLRTVGAKLAPDIAGRFGAEDPEAVLSVEKIIDDEITKVLVHIHRELNDFLVGIGAGGL